MGTVMTVGIGFVETWFLKNNNGKGLSFSYKLPLPVASTPRAKPQNMGHVNLNYTFFFFFDNFKRTLKFWCHEIANTLSHSFLTKIWQTPHLNWRTKGHNTSVLPSSSGKSDAKYKVSSFLPPSLPMSEYLHSSAHNWCPLTNSGLISIALRCLGTSQWDIFAARNLFIWNCGGFCFKINYQKN